MTMFYRTRGGEVVHKAGCPILKRAKKKYPWSWAEINGLNNEDKMLQYLSDNGYRIKPCRTCFNLRGGQNRRD
jgi:hypothetical protein